MKSYTTHEIAHLGHTEILTPKLEESTKFFTDILGLSEVHRTNNSVYLRCYNEYQLYSLILTSSEKAGVGHVAWRTSSVEALERRANALKEAGYGVGWIDGDYGHGKAYQFQGPDGHLQELYYETTRFVPSDEQKPLYKNQPQKHPNTAIGVKKLDHVNFLSSNPAADGGMMEHTLGMRLTEQLQFTDGSRPGVWYSPNNKSYEVVYTKDETGSQGRFHHLAFEVENFQDVAHAADIFNDYGVYIEFAPSKHTINQTYFVYVYEPGGTRVELASGGYSVLEPDWEVISWDEVDRSKGQAWGNKTVSTFHTYGTPNVEE
ncbi:MAG: VOC family protein [Tetragenococcus sp.]|nr:VOC family protein [Tetragenococcus sp.]